MSTFLTIPLDDLRLFLKENHLKIPRTNKAIYDQAWKAISEKSDLAISPLTIQDFILAYNAQGDINESYKISTILFKSDDDLRELTHLLGLSVVQKDRIIRILDYLGLLIDDATTFDSLPKDTLGIIASNLDCRSIAIFRSISKKFAELFKEKEITEFLRLSLYRSAIACPKSDRFRATFLDLTTYDRDQLNRLCLVEKNQGRLAVGSSFFLAIFNPNKVGAWGFNYYGQLGQKKTSGGYTKKPKILSDLKKIKMVAAGTFHALALDYQGRVYAWGANKMGQLGFGISKDVYLPALIPGLEKIMAVYAIGGSSLVINDQGQVYQFGQFLRL